MGPFQTIVALFVAGGLLVNSARAEEASTPLLTALQQTTVTGFEDLGVHWNPGTGTFTMATPVGPAEFEISPYESHLLYFAALADREDFIEGFFLLKAANPEIEFTEENFDPLLLLDPEDLASPAQPNPLNGSNHTHIPYLPEWWRIYKQIPTRTLRLNPTPYATSTRTYLTSGGRIDVSGDIIVHTHDWGLYSFELKYGSSLRTGSIVFMPDGTNVFTPPITDIPIHGGTSNIVIEPDPNFQPNEGSSPSPGSTSGSGVTMIAFPPTHSPIKQPAPVASPEPESNPSETP